MSSEATNSTPSLTTIGTVGTVSLKSGNYLSVKDLVVLKLAFTLSAQVITLGKVSASISTSSSSSVTLDANGVYWY